MAGGRGSQARRMDPRRPRCTREERVIRELPAAHKGARDPDISAVQGML